MALKHFEQFHQGERRLGLAGFIARERIDATAEDFSGFALVECELLAHAGDEAGIDNGRIHLLEQQLEKGESPRPEDSHRQRQRPQRLPA